MSHTVEIGTRIRTWGGWYRHDIVKVDGQEIGRIQTRLRHKRYEVITTHGNACVIGRNIDWLLGRWEACPLNPDNIAW